MSNFLCTHTIPSGKPSTDQMRRGARAAQNDLIVKAYRSFATLGDGTAVCVMQAPSKDALTSWLAKLGMPFDSITNVELEGERAGIQSV